MFGPNIGVSSSAFIIIEAQMTYIIDALRQAIQQNIKTIEPNPVRISEFNQRVDEALKTTVWNKGGCQSYFIDRNGRNSTLWPWTTFKMRQQLSRFNLDEYLLDRQVEKPVEMA
jgi:cyclohexanone monooxygenase